MHNHTAPPLRLSVVHPCTNYPPIARRLGISSASRPPTATRKEAGRDSSSSGTPLPTVKSTHHVWERAQGRVGRTGKGWKSLNLSQFSMAITSQPFLNNQEQSTAFLLFHVLNFMSQRKHHLCLWVFIPRGLYKEEEGARPTGGWGWGIPWVDGRDWEQQAVGVDDGGDGYWEESFMGQGEGEETPLRLSLPV